MKRFFVLMVMLFLFNTPMVWAAPSINRLDEIASNAATLKDFLEDRTLLNEYFVELNNLYPKKNI